jgi:hypothetical protein
VAKHCLFGDNVPAGALDMTPLSARNHGEIPQLGVSLDSADSENEWRQSVFSKTQNRER